MQVFEYFAAPSPPPPLHWKMIVIHLCVRSVNTFDTNGLTDWIEMYSISLKRLILYWNKHERQETITIYNSGKQYSTLYTGVKY